MSTIPKKIHYCWFGGNEKSELIKRCIQSWKTFCPDYEIVEWNEKNFDINQSPFTKKMYGQKKWAFVSDYVRFFVLEKYGGWYLDTDMELFQSLDKISNNEIVLGEENKNIISAGAIGSVTNNSFISQCREYYDKNINELITSPRVMNEVYKNYFNKNSVFILPPIAFYPYNAENIRGFKKENLTSETIGVHFWNYSWGHPVLRFLNNFSIYHSLKRLLDKLHLKTFIKKTLKLART